MKNKLIITFIIGLLAGIPVTFGVSNLYTDLNQQATWSRDAIQELSDMGIFEGYADGSFQPKKEVTREELAVILERLINKIAEKKGVESADVILPPPSEEQENNVVQIVDESKEELVFSYFNPGSTNALEIKDGKLLISVQEPALCDPNYTAYIDASEAAEGKIELEIYHNIDLAVTTCLAAIQDKTLEIDLSEIEGVVPAEYDQNLMVKVLLGDEEKTIEVER